MIAKRTQYIVLKATYNVLWNTSVVLRAADVLPNVRLKLAHVRAEILHKQMVLLRDI